MTRISHASGFRAAAGLVLVAAAGIVGVEIVRVFLSGNLAHTITPHEWCISQLPHGHEEIIDYYLQHRDLPKRFELLDPWGRPYIYIPQRDGSVILGTLGDCKGSDVDLLHFPTADITNDNDKAAQIWIFDEFGTVEGHAQSFYDINHRMPKDLTEMPELTPVMWRSFDGWDPRIFYTLQPDGSGLVTNPGKIGSNHILSLRFTPDDAKATGPTTIPTGEASE